MTNIIQLIIDWAVGSGLSIVGVLVAGFVAHRFGKVFITKSIRKAVVPSKFSSKEAEEKRENTLIRIFHGTFDVVLFLVVGMIVLSELGINIGPLIAGAGIAGLAFGFGGQYLVKDVVTGLFMILENQYRVGDKVCFDKTCGVVEDVSLRKTTLRNEEGGLHFIPHGQIKIVTNMSKEK